MNEIAIERHSFNVAKERLKEFTEKTEAELKIETVEVDGGLFGLGNHKVTGEELNDRLGAVQQNLIDFNKTSNKMLKEFREVYHALDVLDKDYITSIVANVKAIEKTSNDVRVQQGVLKQHNEKLADQQNKLDVQQTEIEKNVTNISKIVTALKVFKEKLEGYKHLTDIDKTWNDCKNIQNEIRVVSDSITKISEKIAEDIAAANDKNEALLDQVNQEISKLCDVIESLKEFTSGISEKLEATVVLLDNQIPVIQETASYVEHLKTIAHINDVDSMWEDLDICKTNIETHRSELDNFAATSEEHISKLAECEKRDEELSSTIQKNKEEVDENIAKAVQNANTAIESLTKKVKYAYWIAGSTAGLAVVELILLLIKVI